MRKITLSFLLISMLLGVSAVFAEGNCKECPCCASMSEEGKTCPMKTAK